jgi:hypothetical protein
VGHVVYSSGLILTSGHAKHRRIDGTMHRHGARNLLRFDVLLAVFFLAFTYHVYYYSICIVCVGDLRGWLDCLFWSAPSCKFALPRCRTVHFLKFEMGDRQGLLKKFGPGTKFKIRP